MTALFFICAVVLATAGLAGMVYATVVLARTTWDKPAELPLDKKSERVGKCCALLLKSLLAFVAGTILCIITSFI